VLEALEALLQMVFKVLILFFQLLPQMEVVMAAQE
jgi:hypothetical protein